MVDVNYQPDEQQLCELLDSYVVALQAGNASACVQWISAHPELATWVANLEALDLLAADRSSPPTTSFRDPPTDTPDEFARPTGRDDRKSNTNFGNFELLEEAGRGGMGVVYRRAKKTSIGRWRSK